MVKHAWCILPGFVLALMPGLAVGQTPVSPSASQAPKPPTLVVTTRLLVLDVVVTDKQGRPVTDLTKDQFTITEDKVPQRVRSFEQPGEHMLPPGDLVHSTADIPKIGRAPVDVLVLDELNTPFEDNAFSRYALQKFLKAQPAIMPPTTLLATNDKSFAVLQDYTQNVSLLEAAVQRDRAEYPWRLAHNGNSGPDAIVRLGQTLDALEEIAQAAAGTPGRKNIIWVGKGFPSVDLTGLDDASAKELQDAVRRCIDLLLRSRVTLYILNPAPLSSAIYDTQTPTDLATLEDETGTEPFANAVRFSTLAPATGGRVFSGRNDVDREMATSIVESSQYYTLTYSPTNDSDSSAAYRQVRVSVDRPGLTVATRDGYYAQPDSANSASDAGPDEGKKQDGLQVLDVANAALSKMVYNGVTVRAGKVTPDRFSLAIADSSLSWTPADDGSSQAEVSIVVVCFSAKGKVLMHRVDEKTLTSRLPNRTRAGEEIFSITANPPAGAARIRFVVRDTVTGHLGTADLDDL